MPCEHIQFPGGSAIVCSRGPRATGKCSFCGRSPAPLLCDGPAPTGVKRETCDAVMCRTCARHVGKDRDLCPKCYSQKYPTLKGV